MMREDFQKIKGLHGYEIREKVLNGTLSPVVLTETLINETHNINSSLNAFLSINEKGAAEQSLAIKRRVSNHHDNNGNKGLMGVPLVIPDMFRMKGTITTYGSPLFNDASDIKDQDEIEKVKNSGAVILGKTTLSEFGLALSEECNISDSCRNPHNPEYSPGGPAGGCAAAIAEGLCPIGMVPDWGGAARIAASCCGTLGLLPSRYLVPIIRPHELLFSERVYNRVGFLASNARDIAMMLNVLAQPDSRDPKCVQNRPVDYEKIFESDTEKLNIAYCTTLELFEVDDEIQRGVKDFAVKLAGLGHRVTEIKPKVNPDYLHHYFAIISVDRYIMIMRELEHRGKKPKELSEPAIRYLKHGDNVTGVQYSMAVLFTEWLRKAIDVYFNDFDLLILPTMAAKVPKLKEVTNFRHYYEDETILRYLGHTCLFNMSGHPALSVPCGHSSNGLPFGVQLVGPHFSETTLLKVAADSEKEV